MMILRTVVFIIVTVLVHTKAVDIGKSKPNLFNPILSSNAYVGHIKENERTVQVEPRIYASDADPSNSQNGQICGYELSLHKHDEIPSTNIPFIVELNTNEVIIKLKSNIDQIDCEIKPTYYLFIRAYDCANDEQRRYSEKSSLIVTVDDINEFKPVFTHKNYLFKLHQDQSCSSCRVEATDDDCGNVNNRVCGYEIITPNVPFSIDSTGSISIVKPLEDEKYEFDVIAIDCFPSSTSKNSKMTSEPAKVIIKIIKSCKPTITDNNPTKLTIHSDHTDLFDTIHVDTCDETCAVEDIVGIVTLDANGIDSGCNLEQCSSVNRKYELIPKDIDYDQAPQSRFMIFDGINQASIVHKNNFSGQLNNDFVIRMWMKHSYDGDDQKEHIFCKSDAKFKNRHHSALFIENGYLKLLIRKGPLSSNDKIEYASEWMWKVPEVNDDQWHSYKLSVNYPNKIDLSIDDQLIEINDDNFKVLKDFPLSIIDGTEDTVFSLGACWHGRASLMVQHFHGQLSGLVIEQKEDIDRSKDCIQECQQYLDMPDIQTQSDIEFASNSNRSIWTLRADSSEAFEQLLKHIVYYNKFDPLGPSGQRTVSIKTTVKCLGENYTYNFPLFTRRLSIDEIIIPTNIELKGDTNILISEQTISQNGIYLFRNLSIYTDNLKKDQIDINDCSINTTPDLLDTEQFILPDDNLQMNNLEKTPTRTGLVLSGSASIDSYQFILQQIAFVSKSPIQYLDRTFSLVCIGAHDHTSTNEIRVRVHIEKEAAPLPPIAAILSDKLYVDNDQIRDNLFDIEGKAAKNASAWPIAIVICISVSIAGVLVVYLVTRIRSGNKQRNQLPNHGEDIHSQMEWEDDIGLNIIVNPLEEPKKSVPSVNPHHHHSIEQTIHEYAATTSEDDDEYECQSNNDYSSEGDDDDDDEDDDQYYDNKQIHTKTHHHHQLEWDDEVMEYGPKKV